MFPGERERERKHSNTLDFKNPELHPKLILFTHQGRNILKTIIRFNIHLF